MKSRSEERLIREAIREIIISEGFFGDLLGGIKSGVGKAYDALTGVIGIESPKSGLLKKLDDLSPDDASSSLFRDEQDDAPFDMSDSDQADAEEEDESGMLDVPFSSIPGVTTSSGVVWTSETENFSRRLRDALDPSVPLHITSALRTPETQARAMLKKYELGGPREMRKIYGRKAEYFLSSPKDASSWARIVKDLQDQGKGFTSGHLMGNAIDIRTRNLSSEQIRELMSTVERLGGRTLLEKNPPHLHVDGI